jgi:hypothetical protein
LQILQADIRCADGVIVGIPLDLMQADSGVAAASKLPCVIGKRERVRHQGAGGNGFTHDALGPEAVEQPGAVVADLRPVQHRLFVVTSAKAGELHAGEHLKWLALVHIAMDVVLDQRAVRRGQRHVEAQPQRVNEVGFAGVVLADHAGGALGDLNVHRFQRAKVLDHDAAELHPRGLVFRADAREPSAAAHPNCLE